MNMILHNNPTALIEQGNTLADPKFKLDSSLKAFDYVVANPPFSDKRWSTGLDPLHDPFERLQPFGTPPAKQGDYAYLRHIVRSLKSTGKGACILPHGVPTYFKHKARQTNPEQLPSPANRDTMLASEIDRIWRKNFESYGAQKAWRWLEREGFQAAPCTVERLMGERGLKVAV